MVSLFIKTLIIYILLVAVLRIMGKRQVGELEVSELVITFLLSELAVLPIVNSSIPVFHAIIPVLLLLALEIAFSLLTSKSAFFRKLLLGKPNIVIRNGKLDMKQLSRLRVSIAELMSELRLQGVSSLEEVDYAIVEDNGRLSVFKTPGAASVTPSDLGLSPQRRGIAHCVISDGKISKSGLADSGKDEKWLECEIKKRGAAIRDICLMTVDDGENVFIIMKEE